MSASPEQIKVRLVKLPLHGIARERAWLRELDDFTSDIRGGCRVNSSDKGLAPGYVFLTAYPLPTSEVPHV